MTTVLDPAATLASMSLEEKVGQVFIFTWRNARQAENDLRLHPGGYIRIYSDALSVKRDSEHIQRLSKIPLVIAADLERGIGGTIAGAVEVVTGMALGATNNESMAYDAGRIIGKEARAMGVNMNYAPVLDVNSNPANPVINTRSYGADPELVGRLGIAFMKGLQSAGVATCGKHFPGHGDTDFDSHAELQAVSATLEQLQKVELEPFREAIAAGVDSIMTAHLHVPAIEPEFIPATMSRNCLEGLLRETLEFKGLIVSDAMDMGAISKRFPPERAIPMAINAGCDQLIMPLDNERAVNALLAAVKSGEVSEERLNEAVLRILELKSRYCHPAAEADSAAAETSFNTPTHQARSREIAEHAITLVKATPHVPLHKSHRYFCLMTSNTADGRGHWIEPMSFADYLREGNWRVQSEVVAPSSHYSGDDWSEIYERAAQADAIIIAAYISIRLASGSIGLSPEQMQQLEPLLKMGKPVILVSFGSPYILSQFPAADGYICAFGATQPLQQAAARALKGEIPFQGTLPISL